MKLQVLAIAAMSLSVAVPSFAQPGRDDRGYERFDRDHDRGPDREWHGRWQRGDRLPPEFRGRRYEYADWRRAHLRPPPRGFRWLMIEDSYVLAGDGWVIADVVPIAGFAPPPPPPPRAYAPPPPDREVAWRNRYSRSYGYDDDPTYRECKDKVDPAGVAIGAIIGGLLGNAAGGRHDGGGATIAGVVAGGAVGAALTHKLDCGDRSYVYKTEMDGFNAGRVNAYYEWRNPQNDHHGRFHVLDYYHDEDGFRCSVYAHEVYIGGRLEEARGRACQQPNGVWAIID